MSNLIVAYLKNRTYRNLIIYTLGAAFPAFLGLFTLPIFTRYLTTEEYGILGYTSALSIFIVVFMTLSLNSYILRYYHYYLDKGQLNIFISSLLLFSFLFTVILLFPFILFGPQIVGFFHVNIPFYPYFFLMLLSSFFSLFSYFPLSIFRMEQNAGKFVFFQLTVSLIGIVGGLVLVIYFEMGVLGRYYGTLIGSLVSFLTSLLILSKYFELKFNWKIVRLGLLYSLPLIPTAIAWISLRMIDRVFLEQLTSLRDLGIYSVASTLGTSVGFITGSAYKTIEPLIFKKADKKGFTNTYKRIKKKYFTILTYFCIILISFSGEIIRLLTAKSFWKASEIFPFFVLAGLIGGFQVFGSLYLMAKNKTSLLFPPVLVGMVFNVILNYLFIPIYGIHGAVFATTSSYFIIFLVTNYLLNNFKGNIGFDFLFDVLLLSICTVACIIVINFNLIGSYWFWGKFIFILSIGVLLFYKEVTNIFEK